ncbi:uncharacterized protein LOC132974804 [Labrus mixtus]|uniref:uncharacterized protein LOC132974804 n=1 Tax=Labrus mixtus TaxID=508554 RepID=UPI0029C08122|nr:uncharacterized protein LOC132974804 [Labrus mixtus]
MNFFKARNIDYVFLCLPANKPADIDSPDTSSTATLAKHYKTLQTLYKRKNPNHQDVSHLLDLEFVAKRAFIDSNTIREEDRHDKVLEAYPCFKDIGHVMEELQRILERDNGSFIDELKGRWCDFCQKVQFFGVWKKMLKPPMGMDQAKQALEILRVLPSLFPSMSAPPKRVRDAGEALVHVLEVSCVKCCSVEKIRTESDAFDNSVPIRWILDGVEEVACSIDKEVIVSAYKKVSGPGPVAGSHCGWQ